MSQMLLPALLHNVRTFMRRVWSVLIRTQSVNVSLTSVNPPVQMLLVSVSWKEMVITGYQGYASPLEFCSWRDTSFQLLAGCKVRRSNACLCPTFCLNNLSYSPSRFTMAHFCQINVDKLSKKLHSI